jgi:rRNA-processing protein FCF1
VCVIVDADVAPMVFSNDSANEFQPVFEWLIGKHDARIVVGGKLLRELYKIERARRLIIELNKLGRVYQVQSTVITEEEKVLRDMGCCRSNDICVIAVARISGARILCSNDGLLQQDFKNLSFIRPKGKVYSRHSHRRLLGHTSSCKKVRNQQ